jgi:hypothetical protein
MLPRLGRRISGLALWSCGRRQHGIVSCPQQKSASGTEASSMIPLNRVAWWTEKSNFEHSESHFFVCSGHAQQGYILATC